jgi:hypothetical protein
MVEGTRPGITLPAAAQAGDRCNKVAKGEREETIERYLAELRRSVDLRDELVLRHAQAQS